MMMMMMMMMMRRMMMMMREDDDEFFGVGSKNKSQSSGSETAFFDRQKSKFLPGYDPRRRGVLCWLTRDRKNHGFCCIFSWLWVYGHLIAKQHFKWSSFAKSKKKLCTKMALKKKKTRPIDIKYIKLDLKTNKTKEKVPKKHHDPQPIIMEPTASFFFYLGKILIIISRPAFELNRSARMMWCISFSRTNGGLVTTPDKHAMASNGGWVFLLGDPLRKGELWL